MVWRHDVNANNFFSLAGYVRHTRATFKTDPLNVLAYTADPAEPFSASDQDRNAYSTGLRFDYTYVHSKEHLIKTGFQIDRTQSVNKTRSVHIWPTMGQAIPTGDLLVSMRDNRQIGYRQEFWIQDQWSPNDQWTFNLGLRGDAIQYLRNEGQVSPRIGAAYKVQSVERLSRVLWPDVHAAEFGSDFIREVEHRRHEGAAGGYDQ